MSGRCTCPHDRPLLLGACVAPPVLDAYCGPACRPGAERCLFRACSPDEGLDTDGACIPLASVARSGPACPPSSALLITGGRTLCVPAAAACPRGTMPRGQACQPAPTCPAGSLWTGQDCLAVVTAGPRGRVLDLGAWAAIALGRDQGAGSPELCRPLESAPLAFDLPTGGHLDLRLTLALSVPDQDLSRVFGSVRVDPGSSAEAPGSRSRASPSRDAGGEEEGAQAADVQAHADHDEGGREDGGGRPRALSPGAMALARRALSTLLEPLSALGGESSTAALELRVRCSVASPSR